MCWLVLENPTNMDSSPGQVLLVGNHQLNVILRLLAHIWKASPANSLSCPHPQTLSPLLYSWERHQGSMGRRTCLVFMRILPPRRRLASLTVTSVHLSKGKDVQDDLSCRLGIRHVHPPLHSTVAHVYKSQKGTRSLLACSLLPHPQSMTETI